MARGADPIEGGSPRPHALLARAWTWVPAAAIGALYLNLARYHGQHMSDRAWVSFRYARNLAEGFGLSWGPGDPGEGFDSPLWVALLALGHLAGFDVSTWAHVLGELGALASVTGAVLLASALGAGRRGLLVAALCASLVHGLHFSASAGFETGLHAALLLGAAAALARRKVLATLLLAALVSVVRPEGPLLTLGLLLPCFGLLAPRVRLLPLLALVPALPWLLLRPDFAPPEALPLLLRVERGLLYVGPALPAFLGLALACRGRSGRREGEILLLVALSLSATVGLGGDPVCFHRLLAPPGLLLAGLGAALLARAEPGWKTRLPLLGALLLLFPLLVPPRLVGKALLARDLPTGAWQEGSLVPSALDMARWIGARLPPGSRIATSHPGVIGGILHDAVIVRFPDDTPGPGRATAEARRVLALRPDLVLLDTYAMPRLEGTWYVPGFSETQAEIFKDPEFQANYASPPQAWLREERGGREVYAVIFLRLDGSAFVGR